MPLAKQLRFAVIGAGISGVLAVIKLREAGFRDIVVFEKAHRLGGTWQANTYPGIACDVPSHVYSYSFAPNPDWNQKFSEGSEILDYLERVARDHEVVPHIRFNVEVQRLEFVDGRWTITTSTGETSQADVVIAATGVLHHPAVPPFQNMDSFEGAIFHSSQWDHEVKVDDARVALVGTGSTAVQIAAAVAPRAAELVIFQRTPQWILPLDNEPYDEDLHARWHENPDEMAAIRRELERIGTSVSNAVVDADSRLMQKIEARCREYLERSVADLALREKLCPDYRPACKRLVFSSNFYTTVQRPNVLLETEPVRGIEPKGIRTSSGVVHEVDVIVLATGFEVDRFTRPIEVVGQGGVRLDDAWAERPTAYLAVSVPSFPNLFMLNGPTGPVGNFSLIGVSELQMGYIMLLVDELASGRCRTLCPSPEALARYDADRTEAAKHTIWATGCRSWYLDSRGVPTAWPWTYDRFRECMADPILADYVRGA